MPSRKRIEDAFGAKKAVVEVLSGGSRLLFDFLRMVCVRFDGGSAAKRISAFCWVDDDGSFFSPAGFGGVDEASVRQAFDSSSKRLLSLTAVRRCRHREARVRGILNRTSWTFGWYGAAPEDLDAAADGGEVRTNWQLLDLVGAEKGQPQSHGRVLHVSAVNRLRSAANLSRLGAMDFRRARVLYCALAGARELVAAGSTQSQPTCSFFHSGTNSLLRTRWYVFWDCNSGTSILPLYDVSFEVTEECLKLANQSPKRKIAEVEQGNLPQKKRRI
ncbi:unnamed protein product [Urochloa decumbens]|uniref:RCD1 WWE domain-containing protein n=1 Tax=Urochloa decumbens TaxID=240449 RepID=A0ABC8YW63_9POAL